MDAMQTGAGEPQKRTPELVPLKVIRVETALSRFPVHRLAKQGTASIEIREKSEAGDVLIRPKPNTRATSRKVAISISQKGRKAKRIPSRGVTRAGNRPQSGGIS